MLDQFPVVVVYPAEKITRVDLFGKSKNLLRPVGIGHLFPAIYLPSRKGGLSKSKTLTGSTALCSINQSAIPRPTMVEQGVIEGSGMCKKCQEVYKSHVDSQWAKFVTGTPLGDKPAPKVKSKSSAKSKIKKPVRKGA